MGAGHGSERGVRRGSRGPIHLRAGPGPDGSLWALDQPAQILYRLDPLTGAVLGQLKLKYRPDSMVITDDAVWIANYYDGRLTDVPRSAVVTGE